MALSLVTAPATEPLTLAEAKLHLRVDINDENDLITALIVAAREYVETFTHRALITQTWDWTCDAFPCGDESVQLPKAPLVSVTSVSYIDGSGSTQTWAASNYTVDAPAGPWALGGRIIPGYNVFYPVTRSIENAVTVRFVAGYGAATAVPASIKAAMKILIGTWFGPGRENVNIGNLVTVIPQTVDALLWPFKAF
jgi:uncharacterized phiE125 gp8 family phage protein